MRDLPNPSHPTVAQFLAVEKKLITQRDDADA